MKLKGINPIEQNADKIVLGVVGLVAVGAVGMQLLPAKTIKIGQEEKTPGTAFDPVVRAAKTLQANVEAAEPKLPEAPSASSGKLTLGADIPAPAAPRVALGPAPAIATVGVVAGPATASYAAPAIPVTSPAVAAPYSAAIHPIERMSPANKGLEKLLPAEQPFDKSIVSIETSFDGTALRAALESDPDGDGGMEPIPRSWWKDALGLGQDMVAIVKVEVEREMVLDAEGRTPVDAKPELVAAMPGRADGLGLWGQVRSIGDVPGTVATLISESQQVERPAFYNTIAGPAWVEPSKIESQGDPLLKKRQVDRLKDALEKVDRKLAEQEAKLAKAPQEGAPAPREPRSGGGGRGGGGGGKGGAGGGGGGGGRSPAQKEEPKIDRRAVERNIATLRKQRDEIIKRLKELGEVVEETVEGAAPVAPVVGEIEGPKGLLENPDVKLWAHDLTVAPGATYRYRTRVVINNPLFDRNLQSNQKELGTQSLLRGEWSEWSDPVMVDPASVFFVTATEEAGVLSSRPRASGALFQMYYGYYRRGTVSLEPGDLVYANAGLPELRMADMAKLKELVDSGKPIPGVETPDAPVSPPGRGITPPPGKGGPGRLAPNQPGPGRDPRMPNRGPEPEAGKPATDGEGKIIWPDWMTVEVPKSLPLSLDAVFLDVLRSESRSQAIMRSSSGMLVMHEPEQDRNNPIYKRVEASANAGETQGAEPPKPVENPIVPPRPDRRETERRPPGGGGGGGGGG